jgi:hypothetical protein
MRPRAARANQRTSHILSMLADYPENVWWLRAEGAPKKPNVQNVSAGA